MRKIHWSAISETDKVIDYGGGFTCNGLTVYWHLHEATRAQDWLTKRSQFQPKPSDIDAGELATLPGYGC